MLGFFDLMLFNDRRLTFRHHCKIARARVGRDVRHRNGQSAADGVTPAPDSTNAVADLDAATAKPTRTDCGQTDTPPCVLTPRGETANITYSKDDPSTDRRRQTQHI